MPQRVEVVLSDEEREVLARWARRPKSAQALALRCRIVLAAADGEPSKEIATQLECVAVDRFESGQRLSDENVRRCRSRNASAVCA